MIHSCVFYATHANAKGVNYTACGSEITRASKIANASKSVSASSIVSESKVVGMGKL